MSGINRVSAVTPPIQSATTTGQVNRSGSGEKTDFGSMLREVLDRVDRDQQSSALAIRDLVAGRTQDVLSVVSEVANADLSFKLLIGVRNKIIEAYKQTVNMQI